MREFPVKAKPVKEVKDGTPFAFTHNSLSFCDLPHRVKA